QNSGAVSQKISAADQVLYLTVFEEKSFFDFENKVAGGGFHLAAAHLGDEKPVGNGAQDRLGVVGPGSHEGICHARDGPVPKRLSTSVSVRGHALFAGGLPVVEIGF